MSNREELLEEATEAYVDYLECELCLGDTAWNMIYADDGRVIDELRDEYHLDDDQLLEWFAAQKARVRSDDAKPAGKSCSDTEQVSGAAPGGSQ